MVKTKNLVSSPEIDECVETAVLTDKGHEYQIVLHNDDHNTFHHVIGCLIKYCEHSLEQAEQCASIVHHNGKCDVKRGSFLKIEPICAALLESGLTAQIQ